MDLISSQPFSRNARPHVFVCTTYTLFTIGICLWCFGWIQKTIQETETENFTGTAFLTLFFHEHNGREMSGQEPVYTDDWILRNLKNFIVDHVAEPIYEMMLDVDEELFYGLPVK